MTDKIDGVISADLKETIIKTLPNIPAIHSTDHSILFHIMGGQTRSFFNELKKRRDLEVLWTGWIGKSWWSYIFSFIPGQCGLLRIIDRKRLDVLIEELGEMSYCGIYFIPNNKVENVLQQVELKTDGLEEIFKAESDYFLLEIDFDYNGGDKDGEVFYRRVTWGDTLDGELQKTLKRSE